MFSARSEARKAAISPMSFGVWKRPSGMRLLNHVQAAVAVDLSDATIGAGARPSSKRGARCAPTITLQRSVTHA